MFRAFQWALGIYCALGWGLFVLLEYGPRREDLPQNQIVVIKPIAEQIAATYDPLSDEPPTVEQAYALLEVQIKKGEARKREAALMKPITNKDCFNKMSPAEQIRRVNEILNTPNAPDEVGRH